MRERMSNERAIEIIKDLKQEAKVDEPELEYTDEEYSQALDIAIESLDNDIKRSENWWRYKGMGNGTGTELHFKCTRCQSILAISSGDEEKPFSFKDDKYVGDNLLPNKCENCGADIVGWKDETKKPTVKYYFKDIEPYERKE